ncbi:MAG: MFS transporter [Clostridia bacterium]|nr:MFS transporter [Clostridia bacterium]
MAYFLFSMFGVYDFSRKIESCCDLISPNSAERIWIRTYPVKLSHLLKNIFDAIIPVCAAASFIGGFESIKFYKFVLPVVFIPIALGTLFFANKITERIPQPPIEKKQEIPFWYGVKEVIHNKYLWINTLTSLIDSMGNGMLDVSMFIFLYTLRLSGLEYSLITTLYAFRGTIPTFIAPYFIKRFPYKKLKIFGITMSGLQRLLWILCLVCFGGNLKLCGWLMFAAVFVCAFISTPSDIANSDMTIRLGDYQMYRSGERLTSFQGVFGWFTGPITTLVGLIIPLLLLKNGFNNQYDILFLDSARNGILVIPLVIDLIGYIFMTVPPLFWDYNIDQHEYVMEVLKQRAALAKEGYIPAEYDGGLDFDKPVGLKDGIPVNAGEILRNRAAEKAVEK